MPVASAFDDRVEIRTLGAPAQHLEGETRVGDERGRVAGATRRLTHGYLPVTDPAHGRNHLANGASVSSSKVEGQVFPAFNDMAERPHVGISQIADIDVVADGGTIRRGIIGTINFDVGALAE